jgi:uncharacterized membrane protein
MITITIFRIAYVALTLLVLSGLYLRLTDHAFGAFMSTIGLILGLIALILVNQLLSNTIRKLEKRNESNPVH